MPKKISDLTAKTTLNNTDSFVLSDGVLGSDRRITTEYLRPIITKGVNDEIVLLKRALEGFAPVGKFFFEGVKVLEKQIESNAFVTPTSTTYTDTTEGKRFDSVLSSDSFVYIFQPSDAPEIPDSGILEVFFDIESISNTPAVGISSFSDPDSPTSFRTIFYRTNGQLFETRGTSVQTPLFRDSTVSYEYTTGDTVSIKIDFDKKEITTSKNGTYSDPLLVSSVFLPEQNFSIGARGALTAVTRAETKPPVFSVLTQDDVFYVSKTGSDSNSGISASSPLLTIQAAINKIPSNRSGKVVVYEGDYRESIDITSSSNINIVAPISERVRILGSDALSFTKTSGYTNIYEATFSSTIPNDLILEDGNPSVIIPISERHSLQKGLEHRLPYSEITDIAFDTDLSTTLTNLDSSAGQYYYDSSNNTIYLHTTDSGDPSANGFSYEIPVRETMSNASSDVITKKAILENIELSFSNRYGADFRGVQSVERYNCRVIYAVNDGFKDDANFLVSYNDEICGTRDGVNGHFNRITDWDSSGLREGRGVHIYVNQWSHDNRDDGTSHHERGQVFTLGCLFEYNHKSGIAPSNDCQWTDHNSICRFNKGNASFGEGVEVINSPIGTTKGIGVTFIGFGTICEGNRIGFRVSTNDNNSMKLFNCVSRENDDFEYRAEYGKIYANNCKFTNSGTSTTKSTASGGEIFVTNDSDLI